MTTTTTIHLQSYKEQATKLAGQIAFLKMYSTRCAQDTARDAVQIFGGRGITQTGMGRFIEHASHHLVVATTLRSR
jgi:alkylation response protein AidB-like acyl-CoA dehydrogenase